MTCTELVVGVTIGTAVAVIAFVSYLIGYKEGHHAATKFSMEKIDELTEFFRQQLRRVTNE